MSQRARILWVIAFAIVPLVALSGLTFWQQLQHEQARVAAERLLLAQAAAFATEAFLDGHVATARAVATHPLIAAARPGEELDALLRRLAAGYPAWEGLGVIDAEGMAVGGSSAGPPLFLGDRAYFREALRTGKPVVSSALIGRRSGKASVIIAVPVAPGRGRGAVVIVPLPTDRFGAALTAKISAPAVGITVVDAEGQAFIRPDPPAGIASLERPGGPDLEAVLAGRSGTRLAGEGEQRTLVAYSPVAAYGWGVLLSEPAQSAFAPARREALERAAALAAIVAAIGVLGWVLAGRVALHAERAERLSGDLRRALETRDEFLAAAAHDLRNPLSTIQAAGEVLERGAMRAGSVPQALLARCSEHILSASRRMARLLEGFLDVAHLQIGRPLELEKHPADLAALLREAVREQEQGSPRHRIAFDAPERLEVEIDAARLRRAFENLLGNAIKYSPEGGEIRVRLQARGGEVLLAVEDQGIGIAPRDLERVFGRFERGADVAGRFSGTGIGLAVARQIVEQHGGSLTVQSELGKGSVFTAHFPALRPCAPKSGRIR